MLLATNQEDFREPFRFYRHLVYASSNSVFSRPPLEASSCLFWNNVLDYVHIRTYYFDIIPCTMPADEEANPYELLGVQLETSEADIRKAYRTRSLKVHPDRVRQMKF